MAVEKFAVSFDPGLAAQVRAEAQAQGESLSGWLADAAARKLRRATARAVLAQYEADHGVITDGELAEVRAQWPV